MTALLQPALHSHLVNRAQVARARTRSARTGLSSCHWCAHHCGVNRLTGEKGLCHAGSGTRVFSAQTEVTDELELIPTFAIAFSGCDLRCSFCITGGPSWNPLAGELFDAGKLAARAEQALAQGARTIMILGGEPSVHLAAALELVAALPDGVPLVWKTNAHASAEARELLDGMFEVWVADYKFGNDACAARLSKVADYNAIVRENLLWAADHADLIVRHLVMPGHVECCWRPIAEWLAAHLPGVKVNLRHGFWPTWQVRHLELRATVTAAHIESSLAIAAEFNLNLVR